MIPFNGVSVLGGIQPAKLAAALLDSPDDGLVARFLWFWPDKVAFRRPVHAADIDGLESDLPSARKPWLGPRRRRPRNRHHAAACRASCGATCSNDGSRTTARSMRTPAACSSRSSARWMASCCGSPWSPNWSAGRRKAGAEPAEVSAACLIAAAESASTTTPSRWRSGSMATPHCRRASATPPCWLATSARPGSRKINKRELKRSPHKSHLDRLAGEGCAGRRGELPGRCRLAARKPQAGRGQSRSASRRLSGQPGCPWGRHMSGWRQYAEALQRGEEPRDDRDNRDVSPAPEPLRPPLAPDRLLADWRAGLLALDIHKHLHSLPLGRWGGLLDDADWLFEHFAAQAARDGGRRRTCSVSGPARTAGAGSPIVYRVRERW